MCHYLKIVDQRSLLGITSWCVWRECISGYEWPLYLVVPLPGCRGSVHVFRIPDMVEGLVK